MLSAIRSALPRLPFFAAALHEAPLEVMAVTHGDMFGMAQALERDLGARRIIEVGKLDKYMRQAALALQDAGDAKTIWRDGRQILVKDHLAPVYRLFGGGLR